MPRLWLLALSRLATVAAVSRPLTATRQIFCHVDDLGEACVFALERWQPGPEDPTFLNVGTGVDLTIGVLVEAVAEFRQQLSRQLVRL